MKRALYICYFGLREPLVQTQVLPYLRELLKDGHEITLLTFEPDFGTVWTTETIAAKKKQMGDSGIEWHCLRYHKRPSAIATAYDVFRGALFVRGMIGRKQVDILHARVHVPALMGALARVFSRRKPKLLFDIRGFFPEEYTEAGIWPEHGLIYRWVKRVEKWLMKVSDGFVVLTEKARNVVFPEASDQSSAQGSEDRSGRPIEVIPCCVDLDGRFSIDRNALRARFRRELGIENRFVFVHAGALGGLYLTPQIADFLKTARDRDPRTFALFLTQTDPKLITPLLQERGFAETDYFVGRVSPDEIPGYLCAADAGLSFVKAGYATQSRSPTKIPEYLACGLPIIANSGVGDVDALIKQNGVGVLIGQLTDDDYAMAIDGVVSMGDISERCRQIARRDFDLECVGGARYKRLYRRLAAGGNR